MDNFLFMWPECEWGVENGEWSQLLRSHLVFQCFVFQLNIPVCGRAAIEWRKQGVGNVENSGEFNLYANEHDILTTGDNYYRHQFSKISKCVVLDICHFQTVIINLIVGLPVMCTIISSFLSPSLGVSIF